MNNEEKIFYKFIENKILLKQFCEEYIKIKSNEEFISKESNKLKLRNCELENEIENYKEILKNIEKKKDDEIENNNFEYDIKIKKLEKNIDFLNTCLNKEKENYNLNIKELISLKFENNKLKSDLNKNENSIVDKKNHNDQNKIVVLNKIYSDIDKKIEDIVKHLNETKNFRHDVEQKIKDYETIINDYLKKISDINLKYEKFYNLYKEAEYKNNMSKSKKKVLKNRIEELKNSNKFLLSQISKLKKDVISLDLEKNEYCSLLRKAEKKNLLFYHKLKKKENKPSFLSSFPNKNHFTYNPINENINKIFHDHLKNNSSLIKDGLIVSQNTFDFKNLKEIKNISLNSKNDINRKALYRLDEFNIKKERKEKNLLFYSDNDHNTKKKINHIILKEDSRCNIST